ncbi:MAG: cell division protein FtsA [Lentisphaerae bacterium]|jgi:cell division protein FtsA|nr:cell division protein FtsA [Lentisphaerota bacterium]
MDPIVVMEIGTSRMRVLVGDVRDDGELVISAVGDSQSSGMRKGEVFHFMSASQCLERALRQAEDMADVKVNEVHLALSGAQIVGVPNRAEISVGEEITAAHVEQVLAEAREIKLPDDREILKSIVGPFSVDGMSGVQPEGLMGQRLAVDVLLIHSRKSHMRNLARLAQELHLKVADILFSGLCAALSTLTAEQKLSGALLIDLGGGTTDYIAYAQAKAAAAGALGVGGYHLTNDIAQAFCLSTNEAEELKIQHGDALMSAAERTKRVPLPVGPGRPPRAAKLSDLQHVIHLRMEETFALIRERLEEAKVLNLLGEGVILTGGGAHLKNVTALAEMVFGLPCKVGVPHSVSGLNINLAKPEYATGVGAILHVYKSAGQRQKQSVWKRLGHWFGFS